MLIIGGDGEEPENRFPDGRVPKVLNRSSRPLMTYPYQPVGKGRLPQAPKNDEMQGAQVPRKEPYIEYAAVTRKEAQRRGSLFSTARYAYAGKPIP